MSSDLKKYFQQIRVQQDEPADVHLIITKVATTVQNLPFIQKPTSTKP